VFPRCVKGEQPSYCGHDCDVREKPYEHEYGTPADGLAATTRRFRKKPVVIEAMQYLGAVELEFLGDSERVRSAADGSGACEIVTLEGVMRCEVGDWIIRGVKGELYPCKPDIFEETYEPA
jgi:hypothetical protein